MSIPQEIAFEGRTVPLYTFEQLSQQPRLKLKNRAMDLRDLVGADRLPPLRPSSSVEEVTSWILDVQCGIAKSAGLDLSPQALGKPAGFGVDDSEDLFHSATKGSTPRQPMADLVQGAGAGAAEAAYESAVAAAQATRARNQSSNIFG